MCLNSSLEQLQGTYAYSVGEHKITCIKVYVQHGVEGNILPVVQALQLIAHVLEQQPRAVTRYLCV